MARLTPDQRREMNANRRRQMMERIDHYFALLPSERTDYLDAQIRRMEALRRERGAQRNSQGGPPSGDNPFGVGRAGRGNWVSLSAEDGNDVAKNASTTRLPKIGPRCLFISRT
jgi:hypothetical protein